jgi:hypothetical protein
MDVYFHSKTQQTTVKCDQQLSKHVRTIRRRAIGPLARQNSTSRLPIPKAYTKKFPISAPKLKDLFIMCEKLMIPREHHPYCHGLKSEKTVRYALPEPNYDESEEESTDVF